MGKVFYHAGESIELSGIVFGDMRAPTTRTDLLLTLADGNATVFEKEVLPKLSRDVLGKIYHHDFADIEIIIEEEKRRFDANMVLLFSIMTSCTASPRLDGVMDREGTRDSGNVSLMYKHLKNHFVQITGTSITQKFMRLISIAHYNPADQGCFKAIEVIRDSRRTLAEQEVVLSEIFLCLLLL